MTNSKYFKYNSRIYSCAASFTGRTEYLNLEIGYRWKVLGAFTGFTELFFLTFFPPEFHLL
jgi:hypothetical protein